jgi:hypothetical protein
VIAKKPFERVRCFAQVGVAAAGTGNPSGGNGTMILRKIIIRPKGRGQIRHEFGTPQPFKVDEGSGLF